MVADGVLATNQRLSQTAIPGPVFVFEDTQLDNLIQWLTRRGYQVVGPTVRDGSIVYEQVRSLGDLPRGWTDEQAPSRYRLKQGGNGTYFGYTLGPQSWKRYLHSPELRLWAAERTGGGTFRILTNAIAEAPRFAFLGVRACDVAAIRLLDRVLLQDRYRDPHYGARRSQALLIAMQCTRSAATCFCASLATGPGVADGADLVLTELSGHASHRFLARAGSEGGQQLLCGLQTAPASKADLEEAETAVQEAAGSQVRSIDLGGLKEILSQNFEHPRWDLAAARCLTCSNCTMVCPTCFCTTVEDSSEIGGQQAERWRRWDSCFTESFSYIHGGSVRNSAKSRYRQWLTHKLAAWVDQFGSSGCVGCGRCITWCPAGIDITEEVRALREGESHGNT